METEGAQHKLRSLIALPEDSGKSPSIHTGLKTICNYSSMGSNALFQPLLKPGNLQGVGGGQFAHDLPHLARSY